MEFLDARRLTGPNVLWEKPGAVLDILCSPEEAERLIPYCEAQIRHMLDAIGWDKESICHRRLTGGVSVAFSAPIDVLYAASAINEWVWECCKSEFLGESMPDLDVTIAEISQAIVEEANPSLRAIEQAAAEQNLALLWDDDDVSIGSGTGSQCWPFRELPDPADLNWSSFHDVPVGIVTGTNGKTTTVRIVKHISQSAGKNVGLSSTDWVSVNDRIIDQDDWSGPGGARLVLRQKDVEVAILETARGGLLRRGLGVNTAAAALITNIAEDHLGDFGSRNLQELLEIKWTVNHAVENSGVLILNADDNLLVGKSGEFGGTVIWFSMNEKNTVVTNHLTNSGIAFIYSDGNLVRAECERREVVCAAKDIPITLDAAAAHNIANCLGAAALADCLGMSIAEIRHGLTTMSADANPGRSNLHSIQDFKVLVDFAHNPEAMKALFSMAHAIPAKRRALCFGQAGDRTDEQIRKLSRSAWNIGIELAIISELEQYARGRAPGEVAGIIRQELLCAGAREDQIRHFNTEKESFDAALDWATEGDLVVILDLGRDSDIQDKLSARHCPASGIDG